MCKDFNFSDDFTRIIEPSWYAWRQPDGISNYTVIVNSSGHFENPQDISRSSDSDGATLVKESDSSIGKKASQIQAGLSIPPQDFSAQLAGNGPGEFYKYDPIAAANESARIHSETYQLVTLAQAHKDGYVMKVWDGSTFKNVPINEVYGDIAEVDIKKVLEGLPKFEDYLVPDPITLELLLPLLRVKSVALSSFVK